MTASLPRRSALALGAGLLAAPFLRARAEGNPIRILVGYAAGGPADIAARIVAEKLALQLQQPVVVDNRPGAGGQLAAIALKAAPADGSVLMLTNTHTVATVPLTVKNPGFSTTRDFRPVGSVATFELALATNPATTNASNLAAFGRWLATHRGDAAIGVPAAASAPEFMASRIARHFQVESLPVPYKGSAPMLPDLLGGTLHGAITSVSDFLPYHRSGRLRILASTRRTPLLPEVPSFEEAGLPGMELTELLGLYAGVGVPEATVARYNAALAQVLAQPEVVEKFRGLDMTTVPGTPADQGERLAKIDRMLGQLVKDSGFKL
ncbi:tripartite tricarboxylate transporter substrate-binding protein [Variovorax sp.]|jgi:tripartite-type tricarboxylate transporter receptor subunit TctC|uniref:tripartite tricarboxylate transporter substrate-binding protein n=1 Tax=Variovorax sp. TaxID=1871043 RepID=UPI0037D99158